MGELDEHMCTGMQVCASRPHRCHTILELVEFGGRVVCDDLVVGIVLNVLPGIEQELTAIG